jgi:hypothetical protein
MFLAHGDTVAALAHHVAEEPREGVLAVNEGGRLRGGGGPAGLGAQRHVFFLFQRRVPRMLDSFKPR